METATQPMQSVKNYEGSYTVLGTSTECVIERAATNWTRWRLFSGGTLVRSFRTKRQALQYCQEHSEL